MPVSVVVEGKPSCRESKPHSAGVPAELLECRRDNQGGMSRSDMQRPKDINTTIWKRLMALLDRMHEVSGTTVSIVQLRDSMDELVRDNTYMWEELEEKRRPWGEETQPLKEEVASLGRHLLLEVNFSKKTSSLGSQRLLEGSFKNYKRW